MPSVPQVKLRSKGELVTCQRQSSFLAAVDDLPTEPAV